MCVWLQKKTSAVKGSVFVHKKKATVREELDKVNKAYAKDNPGLPQKYFDCIN